MSTPPPASMGILGSLRTAGADFLACLRDRLSLFVTELHEEKFRLIQIFAWLVALAFAGVMTLAFASFTLVYFFWESARLAVLGGLTVFYALATAILALCFRRYLARQPRPFDATLQELTGDEKCIRNGS